MKWIFWISAITLFYTYAGYSAVLFLCTLVRKSPILSSPIAPAVSIVIAVRNEAANIPAKLQNLFELDYPQGRIEIVIASDGSTDKTDEILRNAGDRVKAVFLQEHKGKAAALNAATHIAQNEILVFTDARQKIEPQALKLLVSNFADENVGCASGELMLGLDSSGSNAEGLGTYWKLEKKIRELESSVGSVVGATGAFYAVRRSLLKPLPENTILDDVYTPMHVVKAGYRVVFDLTARAWDVPVSTQKNEFRRKVRTLSGNYQLLQLAPWLLGPANPIWLKFVSHKLLRLLSPFMLFAMLITSLASAGAGYQVAALLQLLAYSSVVFALIFPKLSSTLKVPNLALSFAALNAAALAAFVNFLRGKSDVWVR